MRIFYFSGTGNSLWTAKKIAEYFNAELTSISDYNNEEISDKIIGLVFPIYMGDAPWFVKQFLLKLKSRAKYVFAVSTLNGSDKITPKNIDKALCKNGMKLSYYKTLIMPGNCIQSSKEENKKRLSAAPTQLNIILNDIQNQKVNFISDGILPDDRFVENSYFYSKLNIMKMYRVTSKCTGCGLCTQLCPTNNIELKKGKAIHKSIKNCTACYKCFHICPQNAIKLIMPVRSNKFQYIHPEIKITDLK